MSLETVASNVRRQADTVGQRTRGMLQAYRDSQRDAIKIVARNGRSVANTEIGAAKNIYTSARAAFERAREDGLREIARQPADYLPAGRKQVGAAYRTTRYLFHKTRAELTDVANGGFRRMRTEWSGVADSVAASVESVTEAAAGAEDQLSGQEKSGPSTAAKPDETAQGGERKQPARRSAPRKRRTAAARSGAAKTGNSKASSKPGTDAKATSAKRPAASAKATSAKQTETSAKATSAQTTSAKRPETSAKAKPAKQPETSAKATKTADGASNDSSESAS